MELPKEFIKIFSGFSNNLDIKNIIDIGLVAILIYFFLVFIKRTKLFFILNTLIALWLVIVVAKTLDLQLTERLFEPFITFFLLIIVIVFQREIRRFFEWLAISRKYIPFFNKKNISLTKKIVKEVVEAVDELVHDKIGAIIIFEGKHPLEHKIFDGIKLDGEVSSEILVSIFDTNTPGHDGAVIISDNKITQFGVHLPLSANYTNLDKTGTRHRAARGITEISDALAIVVSEERGVVSIALNGVLHKANKEEVVKILNKFVEKNNKTKTHGFKSMLFELVTKNWIEKIIAIIIAIALWVTIVIY